MALSALVVMGCRLTPAFYVRTGQDRAACEKLNEDASVTREEREEARVAFLRRLGGLEVRAVDAPIDEGELSHARLVYPDKRLSVVPVRIVPRLPGLRVTFGVRLGPREALRGWVAPATGDQLYHLAGIRAPGEPDVLNDPMGAAFGSAIDATAAVLTVGVARPGAREALSAFRNPRRVGTPEEEQRVARVERWVSSTVGADEGERRFLLFIEGNDSERWVQPSSSTIEVFDATGGPSPPEALLVIVDQDEQGCSVRHIYELPLPAGDDLASRIRRALSVATLVPASP